MNDTPHREMYVYKTVEGCEIRADVIGASPGSSRPCVVWIHGGGLIFGSRKTSPRAPFLGVLLQRGFVVVSIDHRLAPETKLPGIMDDVHDAWRWVREQGPKLFGVDPARIAMAGGSAGAYLTLIGGYALRPKPRALASFWGYGDITASWERDPSDFYRKMQHVSREEAGQRVGTAAVSEPPHDDRDYFYLYCRQQGQWLAEVTGHDPREDDAWFDPWCPIRNITPNFPPTILVHGTLDTDVPHQESEKLAARFAETGVKHDLLSLEGVGHGFAGAQPKDVERAEVAVAAFLEANLR
jgi:acetyl esterase/lipase